MSRIAKRFAELKKQNRAAFVPFLTAGDPDAETTAALLEKLPAAGADVIELGVPFSDPMADGPAIQASSLRALNAGMTLPKILELVRRFRKHDHTTPIVLMGYYNPIHAYGTARFAKDVAEAGVDGLITVDLPPEEDDVLRLPAAAHKLDIVRLATPTTDDARLSVVLDGAGGFLYYVSIAGVTGTKSFTESDVRTAVARLKSASGLPCAVGFGIKTPEQAAAIAAFADAAVVGSAIVERLASGAEKGERLRDTLEFCAALAQAAHAARG
ncbi:MAG: tryptophan synthase subunit alpha [Alphaproteobacteria bacterium]|nr:tryptophan synthase subunit alpha [Alphaproteobacteria bacterium]MDE2110900.1 tryptophan synthase subunit alpha [Alphaproteobacteria bacterium]MDE2495383.1 tryptophan synthase subunit alpha [Alphaproteobacteria bacterium]